MIIAEKIRIETNNPDRGDLPILSAFEEKYSLSG